MNGSEDRNKRVIGLYGEMRLAMELHKRGWQVYRAYIDDKFDFVIMKTYCENCEKFKDAWKREGTYTTKKGVEKTGKAVTELCETCKQDSLKMLVRFIQVKTSEGVPAKSTKSEEKKKKYSFHPKIRYHLKDGRVFYVWIQVWDKDTHDINYFIFNTDQVKYFDDLELPIYQVVDEQKTELPITKEGKVIKQGQKRPNGKTYDYTVFEKFLNNFECLEKVITEGDSWK